MLSAELCSLNTFLQNNPPCHHALRFPKNPSPEDLGEVVAIGSSSVFFITILMPRMNATWRWINVYWMELGRSMTMIRRWAWGLK